MELRVGFIKLLNNLISNHFNTLLEIEKIEKEKLDLKIEIETRDLNEVKEVLKVGQVHRIMLDNFSYADLTTAVQMINGKYETEASGGINLDTVRHYAECGVDYVSVGALTHSVHNMDLSLKAI